MEPWDHQLGRYDEVWTGLYDNCDFVGFRKKISDTYFYSPDGYVWSGQQIPFDVETEETGLRDRSDQRVFHGDWVILPGKHQQTPKKVIVLNHVEWGPLCWMPEDDWVLPVGNLVPGGGPGQARQVVAKVVGSMHEEPSLALRAMRRLDVYDPNAKASSRDVGIATSMMVVGMVLFGWLQLLAWDSLGPLATWFGGFVGLLGFFSVRTRQERRWLVRSRLFSLARKGSFVFSLLLTAVYCGAMLMKLKGLESAIAHPIIALSGMAVLGWLTSFIAIVISGDLVMFASGNREEPEE